MKKIYSLIYFPFLGGLFFIFKDREDDFLIFHILKALKGSLFFVITYILLNWFYIFISSKMIIIKLMVFIIIYLVLAFYLVFCLLGIYALNKKQRKIFFFIKS